MYGKLFVQMYDGTLATRGPWQALVTFQQMVILCNRTGVVDMTAEAISRRTTVPLEIIETGIVALEAVDPQSRTPDCDGRRIVRLADNRDWGWQIVNYERYRKIRSDEERNAYQRELMRKRRAVSKDVSKVSEVSTCSKQYAEVSSSKALSGKPDPSPPESKINGHRTDAKAVLEFLNAKAGRNYRPVPANIDLIASRLKEGYTLQECKSVIARKCRAWKDDDKMDAFLRPLTLFARSNFANYAGELVDHDGMS